MSLLTDVFQKILKRSLEEENSNWHLCKNKYICGDLFLNVSMTDRGQDVNNIVRSELETAIFYAARIKYTQNQLVAAMNSSEDSSIDAVIAMIDWQWHYNPYITLKNTGPSYLARLDALIKEFKDAWLEYKTMFLAAAKAQYVIIEWSKIPEGYDGSHFVPVPLAQPLQAAFNQRTEDALRILSNLRKMLIERLIETWDNRAYQIVEKQLRTVTDVEEIRFWTAKIAECK